ncbi:MAG: formate dehydrogenase accessory protein FdhE, partial [Desulfovibrionaceae bacterium]
MRMENTTPYDAAIEDLRRRYPAAAPVLDAFAPRAAGQAVLAGRLEAEMHEAGGPGFPVDPERLRGGAPLLADADLTDLGPWLAESARAMLPAAGARLPLAGTARCMEAALESGAIDLPGLTRALLDQNAAPLEAAARALGAPEAELTFLVRCLAAPVLAAVAKRHAAALAKAQWAQGHCPVCGSQPVLATLARREELGLEHLVGGGGGKM